MMKTELFWDPDCSRFFHQKRGHIANSARNRPEWVRNCHSFLNFETRLFFVMELTKIFVYCAGRKWYIPMKISLVLEFRNYSGLATSRLVVKTGWSLDSRPGLVFIVHRWPSCPSSPHTSVRHWSATWTSSAWLHWAYCSQDPCNVFILYVNITSRKS